MLNFQDVSKTSFLSNYWQKKPLVIRQALPNFINPLNKDELAGLAMEDEIESRIVLETPLRTPFWHLQRGPFTVNDFSKLPKTHWTLLVQGVDRVIPEVAALLDFFNFIPQWRVDDVMISYAPMHGSVGPHYDQYDVFLYQASGKRKWSLTTKNCNLNNALQDVDLRIMAEFEVENEYILEANDMLYLPAHVGHHGVSMSNDCMTYSFGYRSYQGQELWDSFGDFLSEKGVFKALYQDPSWVNLPQTSLITTDAWLQARKLMQGMLNDDYSLQTWFGCFVTHLDGQAEQFMVAPLDEDESSSECFIDDLEAATELQRDAICRFACIDDGALRLFINGVEWNIVDVSRDLVYYVANNRLLDMKIILPFMENENNRLFLYELWKLQWIINGNYSNYY